MAINRDRGFVNVVKENKPKGKTSNFRITINPNVRFPDAYFSNDSDGNLVIEGPQSNEARAMIHRLQKLSNWITSDTGIRYLLNYEDGLDNWDKIVEIPEDERFYRVEIGDNHFKLHSHIGINIVHNTKLSINRDKLKTVSSKTLGVPEKSIHFDIRGEGMSWKSYVSKYDRPSLKSD